MKLRDALTQQAPSLELQRAAAAEIARLDSVLARLTEELAAANARIDAILKHSRQREAELRSYIR